MFNEALQLKVHGIQNWLNNQGKVLLYDIDYTILPNTITLTLSPGIRVAGTSNKCPTQVSNMEVSMENLTSLLDSTEWCYCGQCREALVKYTLKESIDPKQSLWWKESVREHMKDYSEQVIKWTKGV